MAALAHKMGKITLIISAHLYIFQRQTQKGKKKPQTISDIIIPMSNCQNSSYFEHEVNLMSNDDMLTHHIINFVIGNYYKFYVFYKFILIEKFINHNKATYPCCQENHKNLIILTNKTRFSIKSILKTVIYASDKL